MPTVGKFTDSSNATFLEAISKSITSDSNSDAHFVLPPFLSRRCSLTSRRHLSSAVKAFHHPNHTRGPTPCTWLLAPWLSMTTCVKVMVGMATGSISSVCIWFLKEAWYVYLWEAISSTSTCPGAADPNSDPSSTPHFWYNLGEHNLLCAGCIYTVCWMGEILRHTLTCLTRLGWGWNKMSIVNVLFINTRLSLGLRENRALPFKVKRNGLFSCLTFMVILFYSYGIHVKNSHLNRTLIKRQNGNLKVQIQCSAIKSEKARAGRDLTGHQPHCPPHQRPLYFCAPSHRM